MNCERYTIRVVEGNTFSLVLPLRRRTYVSQVPIDEDIDCTLLEDVVVKVGSTEYTPSLGTDGVTIIIPATLGRGTYDILLTATYQSSAIRAAYFNGLTIVQYNGQSDAEQYIAGSPVVAQAAFIIGGTLTDEELEQLKQDYINAIAAAEQAAEDAEAAKEEWETKAAALDDVASETQATANKQEIIDALGGIQIDTSDLAKTGTDDSVTLTTMDAKLGTYVQATEAEETEAMTDLMDQLDNI